MRLPNHPLGGERNEEKKRKPKKKNKKWGQRGRDLLRHRGVTGEKTPEGVIRGRGLMMSVARHTRLTETVCAENHGGRINKNEERHYRLLGERSNHS